MEIVNFVNKVIYKGTREEFYEVYELCHQLEQRIPGFYAQVVEIDDRCYLEISFEKIGEFYRVERELSERVKDYFGSYWEVEE